MILDTSEYDTKINIEITLHTWKWLNGLKGPGESFNTVITNLRSQVEATKRIEEK